ncbi:class I poly(R)-hydroxyalkanoic acid synthase [Lacisediminimonas profundi]|uniref:class I poly(R)-hydroxyalkanoic acid synthase n=1 Tax=Lacisediminimonas profundi TaxID=2603856 RepID=UPI00124B0A6F|nr:class I poly(R)-hydroxyalkanoic acid synthase [Lacisediminimonas profundi]
MNTPDPQAAAQAWINEISDPLKWQSWLQQPPFADLFKAGLPKSGPSGELPVAVDPARMKQLQEEYVQQITALWQDLASARAPAVDDKRFAGAAWHSNPLSAFNAAVYLLNGRFLSSMVDAVQATPKVKQKIRFAVQQTVDALSPANFLVTNPEAQQKIIETRGQSLQRGIAHMLADMQKGHISQTDEEAFEIGRNVATTEGAVVYENALFQLIQYKPQTRTVYEKPLVIVPPCINKYYILDLQPANSLVRHAVLQGHTVFLVSWCNPQPELGRLTWDDYVEEGAIRALHVAQEISGQPQVNALGFCVGGTILSTALAVLAARGEKPVSSLTLLTALLDFSDAGTLEVFIDEAQVAHREREIGGGGLMLGREFSAAFSSLRPNDLIWNYVESNYLMGEDPPPFDLLYWNADGTNLPGPMFCWYLRNLYLENSLKVPNKLRVCGQPVDLGAIDVPALIYASREDHIVPWATAYANTRLINRKKPANNRFILGASGHIAGVINPPEKKKRSYWINKQLPVDAQEWLQRATEKPGSWWPEWSAFLARYAGKEVPAPRRYGNAHYKPVEAAPGRYVKVKA